MKRLARVSVLVSACLLGCRDNGLPDKNLPLDEARLRYPNAYLSYEPLADATPVALGGGHWMPSLPVETFPARLLEPAGTAEGVELYVRRGDQAPYGVVYAAAGENRWRPYRRID